MIHPNGLDESSLFETKTLCPRRGAYLFFQTGDVQDRLKPQGGCPLRVQPPLIFSLQRTFLEICLIDHLSERNYGY